MLKFLLKNKKNKLYFKIQKYGKNKKQKALPNPKVLKCIQLIYITAKQI